jgi:galactokinase
MLVSAPSRAEAHFQSRFGRAPTWLVRAPGRVNLIGEHTDYTGGFVLPVAISRDTALAVRPLPQKGVRLYSEHAGETAYFDLENPRKEGLPGWMRYAAGVVAVHRDAGFHFPGWEGVVTTDVPIGAGLSSSAAFELAVARGIWALAGVAWDPVRAAQLCQRAEHLWAGVQCGVMDQMASACGRSGHAMLLDCRSLSPRFSPLPENSRVVVLDTSKRRSLDGSVYNERRDQCELAAKFFNVPSLRDLNAGVLEESSGGPDAELFRRARHVVSENARTLAAFDALQAGRVAELGPLMAASHASLRDDFEVSCVELDVLVRVASGHPGCIGARMTGAGFGGCAVALVRAEGVASFVEEVVAAYRRETGLAAAVFVCDAVDGARLCEPGHGSA